MTVIQEVMTVGAIVLATMLTRFLPFILFPGNKKTPPMVKYLGTVLPAAALGLLVVYSLKDTNILGGSHGIPELLAILVTIGVHLWRRQMILSIAAGTIIYMWLIQVVF